MNGKSANGSVGGMACIEGLPPLPKSLSGLLNSSGGSWREMERMYVKKTMIQDDLSRGRNNADNLLANKPANLDAALALLRKEMVRFQGGCPFLALLCRLIQPSRIPQRNCASLMLLAFGQSYSHVGT